MTWKASDELNGFPLMDPESERQLAKNWMDTAAQYCRDAEYWRAEAISERKTVTTCYMIWAAAGGVAAVWIAWWVLR